jgi:uncharacterized C2H2 Zn-finger protein
MPKTTHICSKCDKTFTSKQNLNRHINNKYGCSKDLSCKRCGQIFNNRYILYKHMNKKNKCANVLTDMAIEALELDLSELYI